MNPEQNPFAEYYDYAGCLLEKKIPRVLPLPLHEEKTTTPLYPNPQHHAREGMRGSWITNCSDCEKPLTTTINLITPRYQEMKRADKRFYKNDQPMPFTEKNTKFINSKRKKILCNDCGTNPKERYNDDLSYFNHLNVVERRKKLNVLKTWREKNQEKRKIVAKKYYLKNKEKIKARSKAYRLKIKGGD